MVSGRSVQEVFVFGSGEEAHAKYLTYYKNSFRPRVAPHTQLVTPATFHYQSALANESSFGCGVDIVPLCVALLRYDVHVIAFTFTMGEADQAGGLRLENIEPILQVIDGKVAAARGNVTPRP